MYKTTHKNQQRRSDALTPKNLASGHETIPPDEQLSFLKKKIHGLELRLTELPPKHPERKLIGRQKFLLQTELAKFKKDKRPGLGACFMDAARDMLPSEKFSEVLERAKHIYDCRKIPDYAVEKREQLLQARHREALG